MHLVHSAHPKPDHVLVHVSDPHSRGRANYTVYSATRQPVAQP